MVGHRQLGILREKGLFRKVRRHFDGNSADAAAFLHDLIDELENPEEIAEAEAQKELGEPVQTVDEGLITGALHPCYLEAVLK